MSIVRSTYFVLQLAPLTLYHLLHHVEVSIKLLEKQVSLTTKYLFKASEVRDSGFYFLVLLSYMVSQTVLLALCLADDLAQSLDVMTLVLI